MNGDDSRRIPRPRSIADFVASCMFILKKLLLI
jgi:hypothetical protein